MFKKYSKTIEELQSDNFTSLPTTLLGKIFFVWVKSKQYLIFFYNIWIIHKYIIYNNVEDGVEHLSNFINTLYFQYQVFGISIKIYWFLYFLIFIAELLLFPIEITGIVFIGNTKKSILSW